jgi:chromosomal replication initiator protein
MGDKARNEMMDVGFGAGMESTTPVTHGAGRPAARVVNEGVVASEAFEKVRAQLRARLGSDVYTSWFGRMKVADVSKGVVRLSVPTAFLRSWINNHYLAVVTELWREADPSNLKIEIIVRSPQRHGVSQGEADSSASLTRKPARTADTSLATGTVAAQPKVDRRQRRGRSFPIRTQSPARSARRSTRVTPSPHSWRARQTAWRYAAARTVAEAGPGSVRFNPLFIHASVGLGKTHLLAGDRS